MSKFPQEFIDEILIKVEISQVISMRIKISKHGHEYHALCPFHNEKTPSFTISPKKNFYYCFGCGASGNAIGFIMRYDQIDFREAVTLLANSLSLPLPQDTENTSNDYNKNQTTKKVLANVVEYYKSQLEKNKEAQDYLNKRGLSPSTISKYSIGLSPKNQPTWSKILEKQDVLPSLEEGGLIYKHDNQRYKTRFIGRLIFPIYNIKGEVIGFGARKTNENDFGPKYINSPETNIFKKSFELYGLYQAKQSIKNTKEIIVVEGYMDVIALSEHSINNVVATLGTAITKNHITTLLKHTDKITFCFDGDNAGKRAAWKALKQVLPFMDRGIEVFFIFLPENQDPDLIVKQQGKDKFVEYLNNKTSATDFFLKKITNNANSISEKTKAYKNAEEIIETISNGVFKNLLKKELEKILNTKSLETKTEHKKETNVNLDEIETIISMIIQNPQAAKNIVIPELISKNHSNKVKWLILITETIKTNDNINTAILLQKWNEHKAQNWLTSLAAKKHLISYEDFQKNIQDRLYFINNKLIQMKINAIIRLAKRESLSNTEKKALYDLIKLKNQAKKHDI